MCRRGHLLMNSAIMPNLGLSALDQSFSAPKMRHHGGEALQLQETNGLFGNPGTADPLRSALDPGAPNINPSNALEAVDALLLGFTPTSSPVGALFAVGTPAGLANPTINLLA